MLAQRLLRARGVFSSNEQLEDVTTHGLAFMFVDFVAGEVVGRLRTTDRDDRLARLAQAKVRTQDRLEGWTTELSLTELVAFFPPLLPSLLLWIALDFPRTTLPLISACWTTIRSYPRTHARRWPGAARAIRLSGARRRSDSTDGRRRSGRDWK